MVVSNKRRNITKAGWFIASVLGEKLDGVLPYSKHGNPLSSVFMHYNHSVVLVKCAHKDVIKFYIVGFLCSQCPVEHLTKIVDVRWYSFYAGLFLTKAEYCAANSQLFTI